MTTTPSKYYSADSDTEVQRLRLLFIYSWLHNTAKVPLCFCSDKTNWWHFSYGTTSNCYKKWELRWQQLSAGSLTKFRLSEYSIKILNNKSWAHIWCLHIELLLFSQKILFILSKTKRSKCPLPYMLIRTNKLNTFQLVYLSFPVAGVCPDELVTKRYIFLNALKFKESVSNGSNINGSKKDSPAQKLSFPNIPSRLAVPSVYSQHLDRGPRFLANKTTRNAERWLMAPGRSMVYNYARFSPN